MSMDIKPYFLRTPLGKELPLLCDSPHSGMTYPADFRPAMAMMDLRQGEDTFVDELWRALPQYGATLLAASFPRTYIDPNRDVNDIDSELLCAGERWPEPLQPTEKTRLGYGLVWRKVRGEPIYDRCLSVAQIEHRITNYYLPYHQTLALEAEKLYQRHGALWHMNLHSMPADAYAGLGLPEKELADFVLGDRDGSTCSPEFMDVIEAYLLGQGYTVARNDPYKGVALIQRMGRPEQGRHSIQIEIKRPLYMDCATREKNANFVRLQNSLTGLAKVVGDYVSDHI